MTREEFIEIMDADREYGPNSVFSNLSVDSTLAGLNVIAKYLPSKGVEGADHDIIYACDIDELVEAGITRDDALYLRQLSWMLQDDEYLACSV